MLLFFCEVEDITEGNTLIGRFGANGIVETGSGYADAVQECPGEKHLTDQGDDIETVVADGIGPGEGDTGQGQDGIQIGRGGDQTFQQEEPPDNSRI